MMSDPANSLRMQRADLDRRLREIDARTDLSVGDKAVEMAVVRTQSPGWMRRAKRDSVEATRGNLLYLRVMNFSPTGTINVSI